MVRTPKGTVKRQETLRVYADEIAQVYQASEETEGVLGSRTIDLENVYDVVDAVRSAYTYITKHHLPSDDADFFTIGMDSLQVIGLTRQLRRIPGLSGIEPSAVYRSPSVSALARDIQEIASSRDSVGRAEDNQQNNLHKILQQYKQRIEELVSEATSGDSHSDSSSGSRKQHTILVTGTTGYIGSYIVDQLLRHPSSPRIICLNRSADAINRQTNRNQERDACLATDFPPDRVVFLASNLGLSDADFRDLLRDATLVIHNAWPVDFNLPLSAFKQALDGLVHIIRFCSLGNHNPALLFVSSISTVMNLEAQTIPEQVMDDLQGPSSGYGESKFVAEHMLLEASRRLHLTAGVIRIGQVSGAAHTPGRWNSRDWLPRMLQSSRYLGVIPEHLGVLNNVNWIPIEILAKFVVDISMDEGGRPSFELYHAVNPQTIPWPKLLPNIVRTLEAHASGPEKPRIISVTRADWVQRLQQSAATFDEDDEAMDKLNPALKLVDFFEQTFRNEASCVLLWNTDNSLKMSHPA